MLGLVPVPPSKRQAAGPLTENLPNVFAFCLLGTKASPENPCPRGKESRFSSRSKILATLQDRAELRVEWSRAPGLGILISHETEVHDKRGHLA